MKYQIFISYRREGGEFLGKILHDRLSDRGYQVFYDVESLRSGVFDEALYRVIDECEDFILLLSPGALDRCRNEDDWVGNEIRHALRLKKNIIPLLMRGFHWPETLPPGMEQLPYYQNAELNQSAEEEYLDAVLNRICNKLLKSAGKMDPSILSRYPIETQELCKVRGLPLTSPFKSVPLELSPLLDFLANYERIAQQRTPLTFAAQSDPDRLLEQNIGYEDLSRSCWDRARMRTIRSNLILLRHLKEFPEWSNAAGNAYEACFAQLLDIYHYFLEDSLNGGARYASFAFLRVLPYLLDWPNDTFGSDTAALKEGDRGLFYYRNALPIEIETWPNIMKSGSITNKDSYYFVNSLFFDTWIEIALLIRQRFSSCSDIDVFLAYQLRCFYKYLLRRKVFLPRSIQQKMSLL